MTVCLLCSLFILWCNSDVFKSVDQSRRNGNTLLSRVLTDPNGWKMNSAPAKNHAESHTSACQGIIKIAELPTETQSTDSHVFAVLFVWELLPVSTGYSFSVAPHNVNERLDCLATKKQNTDLKVVSPSGTLSHIKSARESWTRGAGPMQTIL